MSAFDG